MIYCKLQRQVEPGELFEGWEIRSKRIPHPFNLSKANSHIKYRG